MVDLGVKAGVVEKSGAWFSYDSQRLGQGRENAKTFLKHNPEVGRPGSKQAIRENSGLIAERILDDVDREPKPGRTTPEPHPQDRKVAEIRAPHAAPVDSAARGPRASGPREGLSAAAVRLPGWFPHRREPRASWHIARSVPGAARRRARAVRQNDLPDG